MVVNASNAPEPAMTRNRRDRHVDQAIRGAVDATAFWGGEGAASGTNSHSAATPNMANTKLVTHTASKAPGKAANKKKATTGPSNDPHASIALCTENALAKTAGSLFSEISASRGAARIPLPRRSRPITSSIQP